MMSELPENWVEVPIGTVARIVGGGTPPSKDPANFAVPGQGIPWITPADLSGYRKQTIERGARDLTEVGLAACGATLMPKGTVLFSSRAPIGYVAIAANEISTNQGFKSFILPNGIDSRFTYYQLKRLKAEAEAIATGTTFKELSGAATATLPFKVAPSAEQTRIANQLDTLLARVQACNDRFDAIPALLKRFRQTVLDACLLDDQLALSVETSIQPWALRTVGSVCISISDGPFGSNLKSDDYTSAGVQVVRLENIGHLFFDAKKKTFISAAKYETLSKHTLKKGDLLFSSFVDEEVRVCEFPISTLTINKADCFRMRVDEAQCNRHFLLYRLACKTTYQSLKEQVHGATRPRINLTQLRSYEILLPPLAEQAKIVRRVDALFTLADRIEAHCTAARAQAQRLSPLVLAKAFRGELVQQDPQDEPASVLLQRIAAPPAKVQTSRGRRRSQQETHPSHVPVLQPDWTVLPDGAWAAPADPDGHAAVALLAAVLKAWGRPMPQMQARLATLMCQQPRLFTAVLPADEAAQWRRLVGAAAEPLPAHVASFQPATNSQWRRALAGMRTRGDLVESGSGPQETWALGPGAVQIETAGWPDGRAGWVVAHLQSCGVDAILPVLEPAAREFVNVKAA